MRLAPDLAADALGTERAQRLEAVPVVADRRASAGPDEFEVVRGFFGLADEAVGGEGEPRVEVAAEDDQVRLRGEPDGVFRVRMLAYG